MSDEADRHRQRRYGLTPEQYALMLQAQPTCAICGRPWTADRPPNIDHHHLSGTVRDLLCSQCNTGIGLFQEHIPRLLAAIVYLQVHPSGGYVVLDMLADEAQDGLNGTS